MQRLLRRALAVVMAVAAALGAQVTVPGSTAYAADGCPSSGGVTVPRASASGDVIFRGGGWGHGLGMSQYGAQGAARLGCTARQILTTYYAGTVVTARAMPTSIALRLLDDGYRTDATAQTGPVTWALAGCLTACPPAQPEGSTWQLRVAAATPPATTAHYVLTDVTAGGTAAAVWQGGGADASGALTLQHSGTVVRETTYRSQAGPNLVLDRRLRWDRTVFTLAGTATAPLLDAVQQIDDTADGGAMDKYLWGLAEVPLSWANGSSAALRAQAIAARTYAAKRAGRVLQPTPADQNYTGYAKELEDATWTDSNGRNLRWRAAVDATSGEVLAASSGGALVDTFYSSSFGGHSEDERYVWGVSSPFLRGVEDSRWEMASSNPAEKRSWAVGFSWSTLAEKLGFTSISAISVPHQGDSDRIDGVRVTGVRDGSPVTTYLEGWDVKQALGLLSTGFEISLTRIGGKHAVPLVGDWDGDGTEDLGWFKRGRIALRVVDASGTSVRRYRFGTTGDRPVVGDWNGDGVDEVGVFRRGLWLLRYSQTSGAADRELRFGSTGDRPVAGRWNATTQGIGVFRDGRWLLRDTVSAGQTQRSFRFGRRNGDRPVVGDWDGDGRTTVGVRRGAVWLLRDRNRHGRATRTFSFGRVAGRPVTGDWDGNAVTTVGIVRGRSFLLRDRPGGGRNGGTVSRTVRFAG